MSMLEMPQVDPTDRRDSEDPERGKIFLKFIELASRHDFTQYPRLEKAFTDLESALRDIDINEDEEKEIFSAAMESANTEGGSEKLTDIALILKEIIINNVALRIDSLGPDAKIRLLPLEAALKKFYIRSLEVLAVFQKQEREHLASHRAASSKTEEGYAFGGPELSLEAIRGALRQGVKMIELDASALGDGTPIVSHGLSARIKTSWKKKKIEDITDVKEMQKLGATIDRTGVQMYELEELFKFFSQYKPFAKLNLEIKSPNVVDGLVALIEKYDLQKNVIISAFNPKVLLDIHNRLPDVQIGVNTVVDELNADTILEEDPDPSQPWILPGNIALGGTELPEGEKQNLLAARYRTLPRELRDLLKKTNGYLSIQLPSVKLGLNRQTLKRIADQAEKEGFNLLMFRVERKQAAFLRNEVAFLYINRGEEISYGRMRK